MWIARDENNTLYLFKWKPKRRTFKRWYNKFFIPQQGYWDGSVIAKLNPDSYKDLKWEDDPRPVYVGVFDRYKMSYIFQKCGIEMTKDVIKLIDDLCGSDNVQTNPKQTIPENKIPSKEETEKKEDLFQSIKDKIVDCVDRYFNAFNDHPARIKAASENQKELFDELCWRWQDYDAVKYDPKETWDLNYNDYVDSKG